MRAWAYISIFLGFVMLLTNAARAYDNDGRDAKGNGLLRGGPHRTINELAIDAMAIQTKVPILRAARYREAWELTGPTIVAPGMELINTGDRSHPFRRWVVEGGYTADEPELYNSFQHFYDPRPIDKAYLTDHLAELEYVYKGLAFAGGAIISSGAGAIGAGAIGSGVADAVTFNPRVNARDWALTGEANEGWGANEYSLEKGKWYLQEAYAARDLTARRRRFAQAWRALGETMHLLADMTCVPHVRNDSHPGQPIGWGPIGNTDPNVGYLKNDPYELLTTESVIREVAKSTVVSEMKAKIDATEDPAELFRCVASFTQDNFYSADTIGGELDSPISGQTVKYIPANGQRPYPLPRLSDCTMAEDSYLTRTIDGRKVRMFHTSWLLSNGWATKEDSIKISLACVRDQASILIPIAVHANARLAELFLPRVKFTNCVYTAGTKRIDFKIRLEPGPINTENYTIPVLTGERLIAYVNGTEQPQTLTAVKNEDGGYCDLSQVPLKAGDKLALGIELGGIIYLSDPIDITGAAPAGNQYVPEYSWELRNSAGKTITTGDTATFSHTVTESVRVGGAPGTVKTTISGVALAPAFANQQDQFTVKITMNRSQICTPAVADLKCISNLSLSGYNGTPPRVVSSLVPENPAETALQLNFKRVTPDIYHIDQIGTPRFDYPNTTTILQNDPQGFRGSWYKGSASGRKGITGNGYIAIRYAIDSNSTTIAYQDTGKLTYQLYLNIKYVYKP